MRRRNEPDEVRRAIEEFERLMTLAARGMTGVVPEGLDASHKGVEHDIYELAYGTPERAPTPLLGRIYAGLLRDPELRRAVEDFATTMDAAGVWPFTDYMGEAAGGHFLYIGFVRSDEFRRRHDEWRRSESRARNPGDDERLRDLKRRAAAGEDVALELAQAQEDADGAVARLEALLSGLLARANADLPPHPHRMWPLAMSHLLGLADEVVQGRGTRRRWSVTCADLRHLGMSGLLTWSWEHGGLDGPGHDPASVAPDRSAYALVARATDVLAADGSRRPGWITIGVRAGPRYVRETDHIWLRPSVDHAWPELADEPTVVRDSTVAEWSDPESASGWPDRDRPASEWTARGDGAADRVTTTEEVVLRWLLLRGIHDA